MSPSFDLRLSRSEDGSMAILFAVALPLVLAIGGVAIDYARYVREKSTLQASVDSAALAAAKEISLADATVERLPEVAKTVAENYLNAASGRSENRTAPRVTTEIASNPFEVRVNASLDFVSLFGRIMGFTFPATEARAVARIIGKPNICILGLNPDSPGTVKLDSNARITANDCAVFSNSNSSTGISSLSNAVLSAASICSAGGSEGEARNFAPAPILDCPTFSDPLSDRPAPSSDTCTFTGMRVADQTATLQPGTYCGGLHIDGNSVVSLSPGVYVIKDGDLIVDSNSVMTGRESGFYLQGATSRFLFSSNASVDLEAPKSGPLAGLLFFSDRSQSGTIKNEILSNFTRNLVGTIYLPRSELIIDADQAVADQSAFTAIVAQRIVAQKGPNLVLNTNYNTSTVPVPDGIKGAGQPVVLER